MTKIGFLKMHFLLKISTQSFTFNFLKLFLSDLSHNQKKYEKFFLANPMSA